MERRVSLRVALPPSRRLPPLEGVHLHEESTAFDATDEDVAAWKEGVPPGSDEFDYSSQHENGRELSYVCTYLSHLEHHPQGTDILVSTQDKFRMVKGLH